MSKTVAPPSDSVAASERTPLLIAAEIRSIDTQTREFVVHSAVEIGKRLIEAKALVKHGEWAKWLEEHVSYKQSTANNFMRIATEYAEQSPLALGNLTYSQAVALLSLPADEREQFVAEHDVESMSTRELQAAIKEKQLLEEQLREAEARAEKEKQERQQQQEMYDKYAREAALQNQDRARQIEQLQTELEAARTAQDDQKAEKIKEQLRQAKNETNEQRLRIKQLEEELKKKPIDVPIIEVPEEVKQELEALRKREKELSEVAKTQEEEAAKKIAEMQQLLEKNNNTAAIKVKVCFDTLLGNFNDLLASIVEVKNLEEQAKLRDAIAKLCDRMKDNVMALNGHA